MRILTIDLDYYVDTDNKTRIEKFPIPEDIDCKEEVDRKWEEKYKEFPEIRDIGVREDIEKALQFFREFKGTKLFTQKHSGIVPFIEQNIAPKEEITIINIDHHHDRYHYLKRGEKYNSSTWLTYLESLYSIDVLWVRNEDSETDSLAGEFPYKSSVDISKVDLDNIDMLHMCLSPEWTPKDTVDLGGII